MSFKMFFPPNVLYTYSCVRKTRQNVKCCVCLHKNVHGPSLEQFERELHVLLILQTILKIRLTNKRNLLRFISITMGSIFQPRS